MFDGIKNDYNYILERRFNSPKNIKSFTFYKFLMFLFKQTDILKH